MTEREIEVKEVGENRFIVGGKLVCSPDGVYRVSEDGVAGKRLGNGGVDYCKRLIAGGKV